MWRWVLGWSSEMLQPQRGLEAQIRRVLFPWQCYGNQVLLLTAAQGGISMLHTALVPRKQQTHKQNPTKPADASLKHSFSFSLYTLPAALGEERMNKYKSAKIRACYTFVPPTSIWAPQNNFGGSSKFDQL